MKIVISDCDHTTLAPEESVFKKAGVEYTLLQCHTEEDLIAQCADVDIMLNQYAPVTKRVMEALPKLKYVVRYGVGTDNIDKVSAEELGVLVGNVPDYGMNEVADQALSFMLAMLRKIPKMSKQTKAGVWEYADSIPIHRFSATTIGVIGLGRIGRNFAGKAHALGFNICGYDPYYTPNKEDGTDYIKNVTVEELLKTSDVVSIHCPLDNSRGMLDRESMEMMKPGSYLINVARGGIIDEDALEWALSSGHLGGAAIDCFAVEPAGADHKLFKQPNLIATPHMAWYSEEAAEELKRKIAEEAVRFSKGEQIHYPVNKPSNPRK